MPKTPIKSKKEDSIDWDAAISGAVVHAVTRTKLKPQPSKKKSCKAQDLHYLKEQPITGNVHKLLPVDNTVDGILLDKNSLGDNRGSTHIWTQTELDFLVKYLSGKYSIDNAMKSAGYSGLPISSRYDKARKLVKAYVSGTEDKANIFRDVGLSEAEVAKSIKDLTENARSEQVKLNALALAAKCLRLTDEPERTHQGVTINIITHPGGQQQGAPDRPASTQVSIMPTSKPLQITR
jgi:hypothetical protein